MVAYHVTPTIVVDLYAIEGYVTTWWIGFAFAVIGLVAAIVLRPRAQDKCEIPQEDLPPASAE